MRFRARSRSRLGPTAASAPWQTWSGYDGAGVRAVGVREQHCHANYTADCIRWDWVAIKFTRTGVGNDFKLFMVVKAMSKQEMTRIKNRGYPDCDSSFPPEGNDCQDRTLYGDPGYCTLSAFEGNEGSSQFRARHNCDTSPGHSGSPLYKYDGQWPTIGGIHVSDCGFGQCTMMGELNRLRVITNPVVNTLAGYASMHNPVPMP